MALFCREMSYHNLTPEQKARQNIDRMLVQAGWVVQDYKKIDFKAGQGIAVREYPTDSGPADYMLLVNKKPVGVIEAKRADEGHRISKVEEQSTRYATSELKHFGEVEIPFLYESTGEITRFTDQRDPKPRAREVYLNQAKQEIIEQASSTFTGDIIEYIDDVRKTKEQIIDVVNTDEETYVGWDKEQKKQAETLVENFKAFLEDHKDEITALSIFYNEPYRRREVTFKMVKEVLDLIKQKKPQMAPLNVWNAWEQVERTNGSSPKNDLMALVSLIRTASGIDEQLTPYDKTVNKNFQDWIFGKHAGKPKFSEEQMNWLRMIKDHIATSVHFSKDDLDYAPFDAKGGVGKMYQLFGDEMDDIIEEMNEELVA